MKRRVWLNGIVVVGLLLALSGATGAVTRGAAVASSAIGEVASYRYRQDDPMDPEEFRQVFLTFVAWVDMANAGYPGYEGIEHKVRELTDEEFEYLYEVFPDHRGFADVVERLTSTVGTREESEQILGVASLSSATNLFAPNYPSGTGYGTFTATLEGLGYLTDTNGDGKLNDERCDPNPVAEMQIAVEGLMLAYVAADAFCQTIVVVAGFATNAPFCAASAVLWVSALAVEIPMHQCAFQDALVDSAEIEAVYENSVALSGQLADHDTNIDGDLAAHDAHIDADLAAHDTHMTEHDANIDADLAAHDAHLTEHDAHLAEHDAHLTMHDEKMADLVTTVQFTLDNSVELRSVHLQVIELKEKREFLVAATEGGQPLANVQFVALQVSTKDPVSFMDVTANTTVSMLQEGIYLVQIDLPRQAQNVDIFAFEVRHDNAVPHYGFTLFDRTHENNLGMGQ